MKQNAIFRKSGFGLLALGIVALGLCSCAGVAPTRKVAKLEYAIEAARQAKAITYAPLELRLAEDKYKAVQRAMDEKEYTRAELLADEALLDAELAEARSIAKAAEEQTREMRDSIETLRKEVNR